MLQSLFGAVIGIWARERAVPKWNENHLITLSEK